jgi:preprotein translocase subunit SecB
MSEQEAVFSIQRLYLKELSLESPHTPQIFLEQAQPSVEVQLDVQGSTVVETIYETTVTVTVTTRVGDRVAFLVEAKQAGIFEISGIPEDQLPYVQQVVCANIVYPYLRSNVADAVQRGGFPPIHLAEINFEGLFQQRIASQTSEAGASGLILPN